MISQINIQTLRGLRKTIIPFSTIFTQSISSGVVKHNVKSHGQDNKPKRELKEWRTPLGKPPKKILEIPSDLALFRFLQADFNFTPWGMVNYLKSRAQKIHQNLQDKNKIMEELVGPDLTLAYFIVFQGGKVKFKGHDNWITLNEDKKTTNLPKQFDPNYILSEIDATGIILYYNSLENFQSTKTIKRAIFKRSILFDDWYIDKLSSYFPTLEYLDISDCPKITEKALEALYRCGCLKTLLVTNYSKSAAFELTCLMLEDCLPGLEVVILEPSKIKDTNLIEIFE